MYMWFNGFCIKSHFYSYYRCFSQRMRDGDAFSDDLELTGVGEWGVLIMVCLNFDFQWEACKDCVQEKAQRMHTM